MERVSVLVAEYGVDWSAWARKLRNSADSLIVLIQDDREDEAAFAQRVTGRVGRLHRDGTPVHSAAFVSGARAAPDRDSRTRIVRRLTSLLSERDGDTRLYLDDEAQRQSGRPSLMRALAWALSDLVRGSGLSVAVGDVNSAAVAV